MAKICVAWALQQILTSKFGVLKITILDMPYGRQERLRWEILVTVDCLDCRLQTAPTNSNSGRDSKMSPTFARPECRARSRSSTSTKPWTIRIK
eukprot:scaffold185733_cov36-Tisochrysis_lutea.AAC.1